MGDKPLRKQTSLQLNLCCAALFTQGPAVPAFEKAVASKVCAGYGVAVNSATSALHIACLALGLDVVIAFGLPRLRL